VVQEGAPTLTVPEEPDVVPEEPDVGASDGFDTPSDGSVESGLGRESVNAPTPGSSDSSNVAAIAGSVVAVALLAGLLAMFAFKRDRKQKAWREGIMRDVTLDDMDEDDIEAYDNVVQQQRTKEGLLYPPPPESSDAGSSLFGRMLASTAGVALGSLRFRSENNEECTQENSAEDMLGSSEDDGGSTDARASSEGNDRAPSEGNDRSSDLEAVDDKIIAPVSILRKPKERLAAESPFSKDAPLPTVAPDVAASAPNATNLEGPVPDAVLPAVVSPDVKSPVVVSKAKTAPSQPFTMGFLCGAMHPFHCISPSRGMISQDQMSEGSSIPYQTDFEQDQSWDPDDNSVGSAEGEDNFQTTKPASPSERLLDKNVRKKSFEMTRLRTPAETEPYRPKNYL
jgi:hypothetical protein